MAKGGRELVICGMQALKAPFVATTKREARGMRDVGCRRSCRRNCKPRFQTIGSAEEYSYKFFGLRDHRSRDTRNPLPLNYSQLRTHGFISKAWNNTLAALTPYTPNHGTGAEIQQRSSPVALSRAVCYGKKEKENSGMPSKLPSVGFE